MLPYRAEDLHQPAVAGRKARAHNLVFTDGGGDRLLRGGGLHWRRCAPRRGDRRRQHGGRRRAAPAQHRANLPHAGPLPLVDAHRGPDAGRQLRADALIGAPLPGGGGRPDARHEEQSEASSKRTRQQRSQSTAVSRTSATRMRGQSPHRRRGAGGAGGNHLGGHPMEPGKPPSQTRVRTIDTFLDKKRGAGGRGIGHA